MVRRGGIYNQKLHMFVIFSLVAIATNIIFWFVNKSEQHIRNFPLKNIYG